MDITAFFQQSAGKWVSQRSNHYLVQNQSEGAKSELLVDFLGKEDAEVVQLCQMQQIDPALACCGLKISWNGTVDANPKPQTGSSLVVLISDPEQPHQGQVFSQITQTPTGRLAQLTQAQPTSQLTTGRYSLDADEILTLITERPEFSVEERIWFANPNFRLRTSVVKRAGHYDVASFCSEIRMGAVSAPPTEAPSATAETPG